MSSQGQTAISDVAPMPSDHTTQWFAIKTRSRHEKSVAADLQQRGITTFLPIYEQKRRWSDRWKIVEFPLFSCYAFVSIRPVAEQRLAVLSTHGVVGFVGAHGQGTPIPASQIEDVRTLVVNRVAMWPQPFLKVGQRVRIRGGALDGLEGILAASRGGQQLVISIDIIQRSVSIRLDGYNIEAV